jgi:large conductance mechanosensitive channel
MLQEFKTFILRGNVVDLAVAVIIGSAFGAIISSLVADVITPLLLNPALEAAGAKDIAELKWGSVAYGKFLSATISFIIIAFVLFLILKGINKAKGMKKKQTEEAESAPAPTKEEILLTEIRDLLRK